MSTFEIHTRVLGVLTRMGCRDRHLALGYDGFASGLAKQHRCGHMLNGHEAPGSTDPAQ